MKVIEGAKKPATREEILAAILAYEESGMGTIVQWDSTSRVKGDSKGVKEVVESLYDTDKLILIQNDKPNENGTRDFTFYGNMNILHQMAAESLKQGFEAGYEAGVKDGYKKGLNQQGNK